MNIKTLAVFAIVFAVSMITAGSVYAQNNNIVNPNPPNKPATNTTNNLPALLLGCKDGIVIFLGNGLNMGCAVAPFKYKAFNGVDIKTVNNGTTPVKNNSNSDNILYNTFVKYCNGLKSPQKDPICKLFVIGKGK